MTQQDTPRPRPSILRFTRTMGAPLRQQFPVDSADPADEFTELLERADRRLQGQDESHGA